MIKLNRRVIQLFVQSHVQKIMTMYTDGFINLYDWDERQTHLAPLRCTESFNLSEVEQV